MSAFGAKRKARKIRVQDDDDDDGKTDVAFELPPEEVPQEPPLQATFKTRKPKQSSLRKSINYTEAATDTPRDPVAGSADAEDEGPVVRPSLSRTSTGRLKNRNPSSRLSFGPSAASGAEHDDAIILGLEGPATYPHAKISNLATVAAENNALRKGVTRNSNLPLRSTETDEDRPRYSKEYLSELQSATPNKPTDFTESRMSYEDDDVDMALSLDPAEIDGATVVENALSTSIIPQSTVAVLTEAEIREKKERRSRLAQQGAADDYIAFSDADDDGRANGESYLTVLSRDKSKTKKEKRLTTDDNLEVDETEAFFVEDGALSLGRRAKREASRRKRADMANLISVAEGGKSSSDDSEAERRAAYEAAQTRAGMDGLAAERERQRRTVMGSGGAVSIPPKITPLPDLSVLVAAFQETMARRADDVRRLTEKIDALKREREEVQRREPELQSALNEVADKYRALLGVDAASPTGDNIRASSVAAARSFLDRARAGDRPHGRGLDSLGTTPPRPVSVDTEMDM